MSNKLLLTILFGSFSVFLLTFTFFSQRNQLKLQASAQVPITPTLSPRTPTPAPCGLAGYTFRESCAPDSYRYIDYRCRNGYSSSQGSSTSCKPISTWLAYASNDCNINGCGATPTPTSVSASKYLYLTYTCRSDSRGATYVLNSGNLCKTGSEMLREANNSCYQKTGGACSSLTGVMTNCVETSSFSPPCAVRLSPTYSITRTPTPACLRYIPSDLNGDERIDSSDYALWLQRNAGRNLCPVTPTFTPTRAVSCSPMSCPPPPTGCRWVGGDNCTTCGRVVCSTTPTIAF